MLSAAAVTDRSPILERHPQLYFSDGDIVLVAKVSSKSTSTPTAGSSPQYQLYRVHRPILRHNSPVFANLFADVAPGELYDDVPLVEMIGDTAEDFATLLTFIYNLSDINVRRWDPNTPIAVSPTIRIANKYLVDGLQKYLDWDRREAEIEAMRNAEYTSGARPSSSKPLAHAVPEPTSAIRFALECGSAAILPAAFYQLARTDVSSDWDDPRSYAARADLPARWTFLEGQDFLRHLRGGKRLSRWAASLTTDEMFSEVMHPMCLPWWENTSIPEDVRWEVEEERNADEYPCYALLRLLFETVSREASSGVAVRDPLKALKDCIDYETIPEVTRAPTNALCTTCDLKFRQWVPRARQELWKKLPEYFEVPLSSA
ncbi:hypothetical protein V8D89_002624 [Ganoderma adspersum]